MILPLWMLAISSLVAAAAIYLAKSKRFQAFVVGVVLVWAGGSLAVLTIGDRSGPLWLDTVSVFGLLLVPAAIYCGVPGVLVRNGADPVLIVALTLLASIVGTAVMLVLGLYVACYAYHDCV